MDNSFREKKKALKKTDVGEGGAEFLCFPPDKPLQKRFFPHKTQNVKYYLAASVSFLTFLLYLFSLQNTFVDWDDGDYIINNPHIRSLDVSLIKWAFFQFYAANWHPLTWISHAVDYAVWGLNPMGHHLTNNILHALNTFMVVVLAFRLVESGKRKDVTSGSSACSIEREVLITGGVAGLLFGLHPVHVESVAWVAERKDLLCGLFFLLSITTYANYARIISNGAIQQRPAARLFNGYYLSAIGFFILALLSKPMAVSLPLVLLLLDWYPFARIRSLMTFASAFLEKLPFMVLSLVSAILTIMAQRAEDALVLTDVMPLTSRLLLACRSLVYYLWEMIWPMNLVPYYPYPRNIELLSFEYLSPVVLIIGITMVCVIMVRKHRLWLLVWIFYIVTLLPVLGIVQAGGQSMASRYTYLPSLGPFLIVGSAAAWGWAKGPAREGRGIAKRVLTAGAALFIFAFLAYRTAHQIGIWRNDIELWSSVIEKEPKNDFAYYKRGVAFYKQGHLDQAMVDYNNSIDLAPYHYEAFYSRGLALSKTGRFSEAIKDYTVALYIRPQYAEAYHQRGLTNFYAGQYNAALNDMNKAIEFNLNVALNYVDRGNIYLKTGNKLLAASDFEKACGLGDNGGCGALREILSSLNNQER